MKAIIQFIYGSLIVAGTACFARADVERTPAGTYSLNKGEIIGHVTKGSKLIGEEVKNLDGEKVGKILDLAVDLPAGRIVQVILSTGFLGRDVAIPPSAFRCKADPDNVNNPQVRLDVDKAKLKDAPEFQVSKWDENFQPNRVMEGYRYYGVSAYFADPGARSETPRPDEKGTVFKHTNYWNRLGHVQKASKLIGMSVRSLQNEKIGKVDNLLVDLPAGRVVHVLVATGGFTGLGEELSTIPPSVFRYDAEHEFLSLDASKESLKNAPRYEISDRSLRSTDGLADLEVYRYYRVEPYFRAGDADNTRRNVRDRDESALTPLAQGTSEADMGMTRNIRKAVRERDGLSINAQNVKIITRDGRVTLRGPVNSEEEKKLLGTIAAAIATAQNVDNQLEVKKASPNN